MLTENFASVYTIEGDAFGFLFKNNTLKDLDSLIRFVLEGSMSGIEKKILSNAVFYCFTIGRIRKSENKARGVQIMGLAVISESKFVVNLDTVLIIALDKIMDNPKKATRVLRKLHGSVNAASWPGLMMSEVNKKLVKNCFDRGFQTDFSKTVEISYDSLKLYTEISNTLLEEEIFDVSLKKLFDIFQENLIKIFSSLIHEKRIILYSKTKPCHFICNMTIATCRLISPPIPYISNHHLHPYVTLSNLDFLNSSFFIAGANNPLFRHREQWWDLLADLDTGEVLSSLPTPKLFSDFIQNIQQSLPFEANPELFLRSQFYDFTQHILDSHCFPHIFENFDNKLSNSEAKGELALQYFNLMYKSWPAGFEEVYTLLLRLRLMHITEKVEGIELVYKEICEAVEDEENLKFFLSVLPNCGDLHCVAAGFFIDNVKTWKVCCRILSLVEAVPEGEFLVMMLQPSELNAYIAYKNRL